MIGRGVRPPQPVSIRGRAAGACTNIQQKCGVVAGIALVRHRREALDGRRFKTRFQNRLTSAAYFARLWALVTLPAGRREDRATSFRSDWRRAPPCEATTLTTSNRQPRAA